MLRRRLLLLVGLLGLLESPRPAHAEARVLAPAGQSAGVSQVRLAVALGPDQTATWVSLGLKGPARRALVVLPAAAGSALDTASEAWLPALEICSAPRILAPYGALPSCGGVSPHRVEDTTQIDAAKPLAPTGVSVLSSVQALGELAQSHGFSLGDEDLKALAGASSFVTVELELPAGGGRTPSLRLVTPGSKSALELGLLRGVAGAPLTLFVIAGARTSLPGARELEPEAIDPIWAARSSSSDYAERRQQRLLADDGASFVIEAAGNQPLFNFRLLPDALGVIEPAASSYFARAAALDDVERDSAECISATNEARRTKSVVGRACAPGLLGRVGASACQESVKPGEIDPNTLRCDQADDLALALSGLRIDEVFLTRYSGWIGSAPAALAFQVGGRTERAPVVRAETSDTTGCDPVSGSGGATGSGGRSTGGSGGRDGFGGAGDATGTSGSGTTVIEGDSSSSDVHCGCESTGSGDSCSSNGSSGEDDSCSGDSSGDGSEGDGCSGDSSESDGCGSDGGSEDSGCSGDGADDGGGDCSGGSEGGGDCSGGSEGGGCSGDAGGGGGECSVMRARSRPRVSALSLALFSILLPMRRWARRPRTGRR